MTETDKRPDVAGTGEPSNIAQIIWERSKISWPDAKNIADAILSVLAPHLAASADVRRMALEEAARIADKKNTDLYAVEERLTASFENGLKHEYYLQRKMAQDIAAAIRAVAGSPPSAPEPEKPTLDELLAWAKAHPPSEDDLRAQRESWIRGEMAMGESSALAALQPPKASSAPEPAEYVQPIMTCSKCGAWSAASFICDEPGCPCPMHHLPPSTPPALQPPEAARDVKAIRTERSKIYDNLTEARGALAEAKAEAQRWRRRFEDECDHSELLQRNANESDAACSCLTAERDRLAEIANDCRTFLRGGLAGESQRQGLLNEIDAALMGLEQLAEPSDSEIIPLARIIALEVNPHGWVNMSVAERQGCCAAARMAIQANTPRAVLAAKGGEHG